jgi:hypothetical protein
LSKKHFSSELLNDYLSYLDESINEDEIDEDKFFEEQIYKGIMEKGKSEKISLH